MEPRPTHQTNGWATGLYASALGGWHGLLSLVYSLHESPRVVPFVSSSSACSSFHSGSFCSSSPFSETQLCRSSALVMTRSLRKLSNYLSRGSLPFCRSTPAALFSSL